MRQLTRRLETRYRFRDKAAQGAPQTVPIAKVDVQTVAAGYWASKVIGSNVLNEANETIGSVSV